MQASELIESIEAIQSIWSSVMQKQIAGLSIGLRLIDHAIIKMVLSDEAKLIFGSAFFYPIIASALGFFAIATMPVNIIQKCKCYCLKKLAKMERAAQTLYKYIIAQRKFIVPARVLIGAMHNYYF